MFLLLVGSTSINCLTSNCRNPRGLDGDFYTEGCLRQTCKSGVWRSSLDPMVCCYNNQPYKAENEPIIDSRIEGCNVVYMVCKLKDDRAVVEIEIENSCVKIRNNSLSASYDTTTIPSIDPKVEDESVTDVKCDGRKKKETSFNDLSSIRDLTNAVIAGEVDTVNSFICDGSVDINDFYIPSDDDFEYGMIPDGFEDFNTPLHYAMSMGKVEVVKMLLSFNRTKLGMTNSGGNTPLHLASRGKCKGCVKAFLQDARCTLDIINAKNKEGDTALMVTLRNEDLGSAALLSQVPGIMLGKNEQLLAEKLKEGVAIANAIDNEEKKLENQMAWIEEEIDKVLKKHQERIEALEGKWKKKAKELKNLMRL